MTIPQAFQIAVQHQQAGRLAEAEGLYRQILAAQPNHADALHMLGILAHQAGRPDAADLIRQAIALNPAGLHYHLNLGNVLSEHGRLEEAVAAYRTALRINPQYADAHYNLGRAFQRMDRPDEAIAAYGAVLRIQPGFAMAYNNLGAALRAKGRVDEAITAYRRALQIKPDYVEALNNLGVALYEQGEFAAAADACRRAVQISPAYADACYNLGNALQSQGQLDEAIGAFRRGLQIAPGHAKALNNLGKALRDQGHLDEAGGSFRRAFEIEPDYADALNNLGATLKDQGRLDEAVECFRRAMELQPDSVRIHGNYLGILDYHSQSTLQSLLAAHLEYDSLHAAPLRAAWRRHENTPDPDRPLRLGFVSRHFANHPVGRFLIRPLEHLDCGQFHVACYTDTAAADRMTARIQAAAQAWSDVSRLSDEQLAERIREDRIDILFDLAGHTAGNRLQVFARKPAPLQITWLDYAGTTGLAAMDYILADLREIPPSAEPWYREKVLRMPDDYICYDPPGDAPPVGPLPALANGRVTFASFNFQAKITPEMIGAWARILQRVPHSRLILKNWGLDDPGTNSRFKRFFVGHGIGAERLEFRGASPSREILALYNEVDVALDTFPYSGGLTTCEAIWMGVPVITCPGETFASRHGLAHLSAAGVTETIAGDLEQYVEMAVGLASELDRLGVMRAGLRQRVAGSPLCDGERFARHLSGILREVWRQWALQNQRMEDEV